MVELRYYSDPAAPIANYRLQYRRAISEAWQDVPFVRGDTDTGEPLAIKTEAPQKPISDGMLEALWFQTLAIRGDAPKNDAFHLARAVEKYHGIK